MWEYFADFIKTMNIKNHPNDYEKSLFLKTQKYSKYISWIPWLKMVAICNSLSMYATKWNWSDIDLFIISSKNRLWLVRFLVTCIFHILWVRRYGDKIKDRFCISFLVSENAMDFSEFAIKNDIYLFYWIYFLKPIVNKDGTYEKFIKENKTLWINELMLHGDNKAYILKSWRYISFFDKCKIFDFLNYICKKILKNKTLRHKKRLWDPFGLIVSDDILKFHDNDRRFEIRDAILN